MVGSDVTFNVEDPEGGQSHVRSPLAILVGSAQEGKYEVEEVGNFTLVGVPAMKAPPEFVQK